MQNKKTNTAINGLINGMIQTVTFNPVDRALYLMVKHHRPFFHRSNWLNPYQGMENAIVHRTISYGLYFPLVDFYKNLFNQNIFLSSIGVGTTTALLTNPLNSVKYHHWGKSHNSLTKTAIKMYNEKGIKPFFRGALFTCYRDILFAMAYAGLSEKIRPSVKKYQFADFLVNSSIAMGATIISSPFNYIRNRKFMDGHNINMTSIQIVEELIQQTKKQKGLLNQLYYLQHRLSIGWGTARVGIGMVFSRQIYELLKN